MKYMDPSGQHERFSVALEVMHIEINQFFDVAGLYIFFLWFTWLLSFFKWKAACLSCMVSKVQR